jgi:hypothetical protein
MIMGTRVNYGELGLFCGCLGEFWRTGVIMGTMVNYGRTGVIRYSGHRDFAPSLCLARARSLFCNRT